MTPLGHGLAGTGMFLASGFSFKDIGSKPLLFAGFVLAATLPDVDLLFGVHRQATHSLVFCTLAPALIILAFRLWGVKLSRGVMLGIFAAGLSHLAIDWFSVDNNPPMGMQILWPFSSEYFMSRHPVFPHAQRYPLSQVLSVHNFITFLVELFFGILLCFTLNSLKHFKKFAKGPDEKKEPVFYP